MYSMDTYMRTCMIVMYYSLASILYAHIMIIIICSVDSFYTDLL